jgi:SAM-dependent methyltransferase
MATAGWSEGYTTGAGYTHGYFQGLSPRFAAFALLLDALDGPPPGPCCELGFGQGLSLAMHAAGDPDRRWWGNDFMPEHATHTRGLIDAAGADAVIADQSFEEFAARTDLPQFAFIGLHGVWSWISPANRARITEFLRRQLMPGGIVYISYNTLPGWAPVLPLQALLREHVRRASPPGRSDVGRTSDALAFLQAVLAANPQVAEVSPALRQTVAHWASQAPAYLTHELAVEDWHPMDFTQVAAELETAKLSFAASANLHDRNVDLNLLAAQQALLAQIEDPALREATKDVFMARRFRLEYWVRGARPLARSEAARRLREQRIVLAIEPAEMPTLLTGAQGTEPLPAQPLALLVETLVQADAPVAIGRILDRAATAGLDANEMVELVATLVGARALLLAAAPETVESARPATRRLNAHLLAPHARRAEIWQLASPVSGGGVAAIASLQTMLFARTQAPSEPGRWAGMAWDAMLAEGLQLMKDGQRVTDRATAMTVLQPLVQTLQERTLPQLRRLGVID